MSSAVIVSNAQLQFCPLFNIVETKVQKDNVHDVIDSLQNLLLKYKMYSKSNSSQPPSTGGLQQFITRRLKAREERGQSGWTNRLTALYSNNNCTIISPRDDTDGNSFFQSMPVDIKLQIFSYLDSRSLCVACCVNREWYQLTCDDLLWKGLLRNDVKKWSRISHVTNPKTYFDVGSDWSHKEIYLKCSPDFQRQLRHSNSTFHQVSTVLKSFIPKKVPKVAMFGPGLETATSGLVRRMLYEDNQTFTRTAMFPGQFEGIGGGITLKLLTNHSLHLSVLYSASKHEREQRRDLNRLQQNKLLQKMDKLERGEGENDEQEYELKPQIKHLCHTLDAFIFVVDASEPKEAIACSRGELMAMVKERKSTPHVPLLVLSCIRQPGENRLPACDIVESLNLSSISQPWIVVDCESESLRCVDEGIVWLVEQAQYR